MNQVRYSSLLILTAGLITSVSAAPAPPLTLDGAAAQAARAERRVSSRVVVTVPAEDAELMVNGTVISGAGMSRTFDTGPLSDGTHKYSVSVTWEPNTYTKMTRSKVVTFRAGEAVRVDLTVEAPDDRVRVIYVPTPFEVAAAMVELAGVTERDVVYEPGCGDARITIAAIRAGARRGVCVDIDPERARESKANVETAGFANRIDVREGDALDVKNLSDVSVVLLYMGDHFNLLIRPVLWRELKTGSRIVSHRFLMGDWPPDKTISVSTAEGVFELHLWTITEELKRRRP
jgi:uncharacterized protein (TIGR03000 family)